MKLVLLFLICTFSFSIYSQQSLVAHRIAAEITIDGSLSDPVWDQSAVASQFTSWQPVPGRTPSFETEVRLLYDDEAIYIGALMKVPHRDSIMTELTQRDDLGNTDFFGIFLDTYGNGTDAFEFIIGATGVQFDAKLSQRSEDQNWDAIWHSAVELSDKYWSAEMKIPYAAIRFSKEKVQKWKMNFVRRSANTNERSSWIPIDPEAPVFLAQMGDIQGITGIKAPLRLSISPYLSTYVQHRSDKSNDITSTGYSYNGGMDLKYGINDAFTLDLTLIPDFGQVQSDNLVLNLSPFEVRYNENRQFFTEGTELFSKGGLFYSRRVGGIPIGQDMAYDQLEENEEVVTNPSTSQLINASKISGRTGKGLGIGIFNAIAKETNAVIENTVTGKERMIKTAPLTNYNVLALDQNLKNNSSVSLINTNVWRAGEDYYNANVTASQVDLKVANQQIGIRGGIAVSQKYFPSSDDEFGLKYELDIRKIAGNLNYGIEYEHRGEQFDPNDLGFQSYNNERSIEASAQYQINEPFGNFNRAQFWFNYEYSRLINPDKYAEMHFNSGFWMQTKSFFNINMWMNYAPETYDFYEPRTWGRYYQEPSWGNIGFSMGTDGRKKFRLSSYIVYRKVDQAERNSIGYSVRPRYRFSDRLNVSLDLGYDRSRNTPRFVENLNDEIIFGKRMRTTVENSIRLNYSFTDKMGLDFRLRHYWAKVDYNGYNLLTEEGGLTTTDYDSFNDFTYSLFNIDLNYRWRFAPGSDLIFNWKNNIAGVSSDKTLDYPNLSYFSGLKSLEDYPEDNSISLRIVYYIDYQQFRKII